MIRDLIKKVLLGCMCLLGLQIYAMTSDNTADDRKEEKKTERKITNATRPSPRNTNDLNVLLTVLNLSRSMPSRLINAEYLNRMLQRFLNNGGDPNEPIVRKTTLLNVLVEMGDYYLPLIKMLVDHGIRFDSKNGADETAFATAQRTKGTEEILAFFSQQILQNQDMRSVDMRKKQPLVESLSSSSSSSSSASAISAPHLTIEVPADVAQQVSTIQVIEDHGGQHRRTVSNSFFVPPIDPSEVQVPVTGRIEPAIQEEKQQEDDMSIYDLSRENHVQSPQAQRKVELSLDMNCLHASRKKNAESTTTPNNSAVESGTSAATTPSTIRHDIGAAFPSMPSDRSTSSNRANVSTSQRSSQRSEISSDSQRKQPIAPPNSAKTPGGNTSGSLPEHRLAVSKQNDHSQDLQRSKTASPRNAHSVDLLTVVANDMHYDNQPSAHIDEAKGQSDKQMEASDVAMHTSNVLPHMVQAISVVSVPVLEADAMSPLPSSPTQVMSGSQTVASQYEMSKNHNNTIAELGVQGRAPYVRSPAMVLQDPSQEQNQVQPTWGQLTGNPVVVRTKLSWYKRLFCCCCGGNSQ